MHSIVIKTREKIISERKVENERKTEKIQSIWAEYVEVKDP